MTSFIKDEISTSVKVEVYQATLLWRNDSVKCNDDLRHFRNMVPNSLTIVNRVLLVLLNKNLTFERFLGSRELLLKWHISGEIELVIIYFANKVFHTISSPNQNKAKRSSK